MSFTTTFQLYDSDGKLLTEKHNAGRLIFWLKENQYFEKHPDTTLTCTELFTNKFKMTITADTTSQDIETAWNKLNFYI